MTPYQSGILLALATAATWTGSSLAFSNASRRVGSVPVNLIRLVMALLLLTALCAITRGKAIPTDATAYQVQWLAISGVVGFFVGDLTLFRAFVLIGPRRSTLLMSLAPAFAAAAGFVAFGERLNVVQLLGVAATLVGVMWVVAERTSNDDGAARVSRWGITLGFLGALGQGVGAVLTKHAFRYGNFDPFASTQIRAAAAIPLFVLFVVFTGRSRDTLAALRNGPAMGFMTLGAICGPFLGVSMFNASVARIPSGVTSTLAGMVPVFMLPVAALARRERVTPRSIIGAVVAVGGVALLAMGG